MNSFVFNARIANQQRGARAFVQEPGKLSLGLGRFFSLSAHSFAETLSRALQMAIRRPNGEESVGA
jgi:hypothetical protein